MKRQFIFMAMILYAILGNGQTPTIASHLPNVRVFPTSAKNQSEVSISINTQDPTNIIVSANTSPNVGLIAGNMVTTGFYVSLDGGATYTSNESDAMPNSQDGFTDPGTCFDVEGNAFLSALNHQSINSSMNGGHPFALLLQSSTDKGTTWSNSVNIFSNPTDWVDKEAIVGIDDNVNSPFVQNVYCAWQDLTVYSVINVSTSTNNGASFSNPVIASANNAYGPSIQVGPNGEVYTASANNGLIYFQFSIFK